MSQASVDDRDTVISALHEALRDVRQIEERGGTVLLTTTVDGGRRVYLRVWAEPLGAPDESRIIMGDPT